MNSSFAQQLPLVLLGSVVWFTTFACAPVAAEAPSQNDELTPIKLPKQTMKTELIDPLNEAIESGDAGPAIDVSRARQFALGGNWRRAAADLAMHSSVSLAN